ncbi:MAG: methyl-accepting chemotaxis protein [Rheinheimera sp.]|nr:methyl-accepting chemotaxis protein [Rheinheimera sp.]
MSSGFQFSTMRLQIAVVAASCLVIAVAASIGFGVVSSQRLFEINRSNSTALSVQQISRALDGQLQQQADYVELLITRSLGVAKGLADATDALSGVNAPLSREQYSEVVRRAMLNNPQLLGAYIVWEPGAVDDRDADYRGNGKHSTAEGQFGPYWTRDSKGKLDIQPVSTSGLYDETRNSQGLRGSEWYLCPRDRKSSCIIDPALWTVQGVPTLMTSIVHPIYQEQKFIGIAGVDISMAFMQQLLTEQDQGLYSGAGELRIISYHGYIVADTADPSKIGTVLENSAWQALRPSVQNGQRSFEQVKDNFYVAVPIRLAAFDSPWLLQYEVPAAVALAEVEALNNSLTSEYNRSTLWQVLLGAVIAVLGALILYIVAGRLAKPLQDVTAKVEKLAQSEGDLTSRMALNRKDEIGHLATALDLFLDKTHHIVRDTAQLVAELKLSSDTSAEISGRTHQDVSLQQKAIEQVATAVTQMSSTAAEVANQAAVTADLSQQASLAVKDGDSAVEQNSSFITTLADSMQQSGQMMTQLEQASASINNIVEVIKNISEQTNLLALNAAIEAARAGEQGRGFAVVADEVRSLASRTQQSTGEIQLLITDLTSRTQQVVKAMLQNRQMTEQCQQTAAAAQQKLQQAISAAASISDAATQIASAAEQQSVVSEDVSNNVVQISSAVTGLSQSATDAAEQSRLIASIAVKIDRQISRFRY